MSTSKGLKRLGDFFTKSTAPFTNQTGAALLAGHLVALNFDFANATYVAFDLSSATDVRKHVVAVTTANAIRMMAVALEPIAAGKVGDFGIEGVFPVRFNGAVAAGNFIGGTNGQVYATVYADQAALDALALPTGLIGVALETLGAAGFANCDFDGRAWRHLIGGGA